MRVHEVAVLPRQLPVEVSEVVIVVRMDVVRELVQQDGNERGVRPQPRPVVGPKP